MPGPPQASILAAGRLLPGWADSSFRGGSWAPRHSGARGPPPRRGSLLTHWRRPRYPPSGAAPAAAAAPDSARTRRSGRWRSGQRDGVVRRPPGPAAPAPARPAPPAHLAALRGLEAMRPRDDAMQSLHQLLRRGNGVSEGEAARASLPGTSPGVRRRLQLPHPRPTPAPRATGNVGAAGFQ